MRDSKRLVNRTSDPEIYKMRFRDEIRTNWKESLTRINRQVGSYVRIEKVDNCNKKIHKY